MQSMVQMAKWEDISDILLPEAKDKIKTGQVLGFMRDGGVYHYQVKRISKGKVWVEPLKTLYDSEQLTSMPEKELRRRLKHGK